MKICVKYLLCILLSLTCLFTCLGYALLSGNLMVSGSAQAEAVYPDVYISDVARKSGTSVMLVGFSDTLLSTEIASVGATTFRVTVKNISDKIYVYERVLNDEITGVTYEVSGLNALDEISPNGGELSFDVTITVQRVPSDDAMKSYALKFKFIEKTGTEILPGDDHLDITFRYNNGQADTVVSVYINEFLERPEVPVKEGYTFIGWYTDDTYTTAWNFEVDRVAHEMTLYAGWARSTYTVTFVIGGGLDNLVVTASAGSLLTSPASPVKTGYVFTGWYVDEGCTTLWDFSADTVVADMTLFGGWELYIPPRPPECGVVFKPNNGEQDIKITALVDHLIPEPTTPTREGYTFVGWYVDEALTTPWNFETDIVVDHMTLFGKWEKVIVIYTVTFQPNNGAAVTTASVEEGKLISIPTPPTREGYTFVGWYQDDLATPWNFDTDKPVENMTLYAKWEKAQSSDPGDALHSDFLGLVEALLNGNVANALNKSEGYKIYNAIQNVNHSTQAPIMHCSINCIPGTTMSSLAHAANGNLTEELQFVFMKDPNNKDRLFLYMYYASDCDDAEKGSEILTYFQILSRDGEGKWFADGTYQGTAVVGNYYAGHNNQGKTEWTIDVYSWKASSRSVE